MKCLKCGAEMKKEDCLIVVDFAAHNPEALDIFITHRGDCAAVMNGFTDEGGFILLED